MKRLLCIFLVLGLALGMQAKKIAFMVGVGRYPASSGWNTIHAENDIMMLRPLLLKQRFEVITLLDEHATKRNIVRGLESLIRRVKSGDEVYIHFSCHGQQMEDLQGDEPDGRDETLIPYDAQKIYRAGVYEGENHLTDDEMNKYVNKLKTKLGLKGFMFISLDACHSGDGIRGEVNIDNSESLDLVRGTDIVFSKKGTSLKTSNKTMRFQKRLQIKGPAGLAVISACFPNERNFEHIERQGNRKMYYGSLSFCLSKIMQEKKDIRQWGRFFKLQQYKGKKIFLPSQHPYYEEY